MVDILKKLEGGDRRSIGRADEVAKHVWEHPELFPVIFRGMLHNDPLIRMRSADAIEKVTARRPDLLQPHKAALIHEVAVQKQQEVRWHVAQMLPRLRLDQDEVETVVTILMECLEDASSIVKTSSMQALADLAMSHHDLRPRVIPLIQRLTREGTPAMRSRGRKLLARLMPG
jgi:hypothetical protein